MKKVPWDISCIVLAAGKGSRLDHNKILRKVGQRTLLQRVISAISSFTKDMIIVSSEGQSFPHLSCRPGLRIVTDIYPGKGALGGLYTGLAVSNSFDNLVVAADMPFLNQIFLAYLIQLAPGFDAIVPRLGNMVEPLHAVYSIRCLPPIESLLRQGNLKISDLLPLIRTRYVEAQEIDTIDPGHLSFFNVNTKSDLAKAKKLAKKN